MSLRRVSGGCWWFFVVCLTKTEKKGERERRTGENEHAGLFSFFFSFLAWNHLKKASSFFIRISIETIIISFLSFLCVSVANTAAKERKKNLKNVRFFFRDWRREERRRRRKNKENGLSAECAHFLFFVRVRRGETRAVESWKEEKSPADWSWTWKQATNFSRVLFP